VSTSAGRIAVLDMAGTTVADDGTVVDAFVTAADAVGLGSVAERGRMIDYVRDTMGQSKIEVFTALCEGNRDRAVRANQAFEEAYAATLDQVRPIPQALETIQLLRAGGIRVALTTGFSSDTQRALLDALGWQDAVDAVLAPTLSIRGRPFPDLPLAALITLRGAAVSDLIVVGDTASDMRSGKSAGAGVVAGVLTGAHGRDELRTAGATHVLGSVADLPARLGLTTARPGSASLIRRH
jgi:phosphonatase-like hydrolase